MTYSPITKALPEFLRGSNRLSLLASVGFHGLLFGVLALLPANSKGINTGRVVNLINLSPAERSRLPAFTKGAEIDPSVPPPALNVPLFDLPSLAELPDFSLSSPSFNSEASGELVTPTLPSPSTTAVPELVPQQAPLLSFPIKIPPLKGPLAVNPENYTPLPPQLNIGSRPLPTLQPGFPLPPPDEPRAAASPPPLPEVSPRPEPTTSASPRPTRPGRTQATGRLGMWLVTARQAYDSDLVPQRQEAVYQYPEAACKDRLQGNAIVAALVDPGGRLVDSAIENPIFLSTTGKPVLDEAAMSSIRNYDFASSGKYQALVLGFNFRYSPSVCAGTAPLEPDQPASPANSPAPEPQSQDDTSKPGTAEDLKNTQPSSTNNTEIAPQSRESEANSTSDATTESETAPVATEEAPAKAAEETVVADEETETAEESSNAVAEARSETKIMEEAGTPSPSL